MHRILNFLTEPSSPSANLFSPPASPSTPSEEYEKVAEVGQQFFGRANAPSPRKYLTGISLEKRDVELSPVTIDYYSIISHLENALKYRQPDQNLEFSLWSSIVLAARNGAQQSLEPSFRHFFNLKLVHATEQCLEFHHDRETRNRLCNQIIAIAESCLGSDFNKPNTLVFLYGFIASAYHNMGNYGKASEAAEIGLEVPNANPIFYMQLYIEYAEALSKLKRYEDAKGVIDRALSQSPSDEERNLLSRIGESLNRCQDLEREPKRHHLDSF